ncbi:MAG: dTDP-4-dehydrorhamnose reductase [Thermoplasmata archaeon]
MSTLLVLGGSGLLGSRLSTAGIKEHEVVATHRSIVPELEGVRLVEMHKERTEEAVDVLRQVHPDYVVDTAAFHNVDGCEEERELAWRVNVIGTAELCRAARGIGARYLYVSTDFVFDGDAGPYKEDDKAEPVNYYGVTKLEAERAVMGEHEGNQVVRPSVIYGWNETRLNFATWVLTTLREGKEVRCVTDWYGSPTLADSLAEAMLRLLRIDEGGVFHLAGLDCMSRFDFARRLAKAFELDLDLVQPVKATQLGMRARRPANSCLINRRAAKHGINPIGVEEGLTLMRSQRTLESFETPARFKS